MLEPTLANVRQNLIMKKHQPQPVFIITKGQETVKGPRGSVRAWCSERAALRNAKKFRGGLAWKLCGETYVRKIPKQNR
jgi:hypothetical protein